MARAHHTHLRAHKEHYHMDGEHNYCRALIHNFYRVGQVRPPECVKKSAEKYYNHSTAKPIKEMEECDVPVCSPCMYGDGKGNLSPYKHKLPIYNGTIRETFRQYKGPGGKTKFRPCYTAHSHAQQYALWYRLNRCHYNLAYPFKNKREAEKPSCFTYRGSGAFEKPNIAFTHGNINRHMTLSRCRIRQCTIRLVWFLFYNEDEKIIIDTQSSKEPRKFVFVEGTKAIIKYYVFGIHLKSGMKILPINKTKKNVVKEWKNNVEHVPKLSVLQLGTTAKQEYNGKYMFLYHFDEADPTVELGTYSQLFDIEVRKPLTISLSPLSVHICEFEKGKIYLTTHGEFDVFSQDIEWSYAFTKHQTPTVVTLRTTFIKISANGRAIQVSQAAFVFVKVRWKHGKETAQARVFVTGKPRLQNVSPLLTITYPGNMVKIALATDSPHNKLTWVHDAQKIEEVPEQPNMFFSQKRTAKDIIYVLTIDNILKEQFGVYTIKAVNTKNCRYSMEFIVRKPVEQNDYTDRSEDETTSIPLSNSSRIQFKAVMDFMQKDCVDVIGHPQIVPASSSTAILDDSIPEWKKEKLINSPMDIYDISSSLAPYCISLQNSKPYFQLNLVHLTRIKGLRILQDPSKDDSDFGLRLMYSIDGCKWKIFGARPKLPQVSIATNETVKTEIKQENIPQSFIEKIESRYESRVFTVDGSRFWIGNESLVFAKYIRLVPTNTSTRNKSCIRLQIYGCSAGILEMAKPKPVMHRKTDVLAVVLGVFGGLVGTIIVSVGSWYVFKRWKTIVRFTINCWITIRLLLTSEDDEGYYEYYELSGSDDSEEHIYCEIQDLESMSDNVNVSTDGK